MGRERRFPRNAETHEVPLATLSPGRRFRMVLQSGKRYNYIYGEIVSKGSGSVEVIVSGKINTGNGNKRFENKIQYWDLETPVVSEKQIKRFPRLPRRFPRLAGDGKKRFPRLK